MRFPATIYPSSSVYNIYLQSYKEWLAKQSIAKNTQRAYHSRIKQFLLFREYANLSDHLLDDLNATSDAMSLYLNFLKQSTDKVRAINANVNALNNFCHFLGLKVSQLKRERCYYKPLKILRLQEQNDFLLSIRRQESARDRALSMVLLYTGLRIGDCARLNVADFFSSLTGSDNKFDLKDGTACLCLNNRSGCVTKIPLDGPTAFALKQWLKEREKLAAAETEPALWLTKDGERLSISGITFVIKRIGWQAQLAVSTEILRRTWLASAADCFDKKELATKFGGYISPATIKRYGIILQSN